MNAFYISTISFRTHHNSFALLDKPFLTRLNILFVVLTFTFGMTSSVAIHAQTPSEICNNGLDDDGDGAIDCFDFDCPCVCASNTLDASGLATIGSNSLNHIYSASANNLTGQVYVTWEDGSGPTLNPINTGGTQGLWLGAGSSQQTDGENYKIEFEEDVNQVDISFIGINNNLEGTEILKNFTAFTYSNQTVNVTFGYEDRSNRVNGNGLAPTWYDYGNNILQGRQEVNCSTLPGGTASGSCCDDGGVFTFVSSTPFRSLTFRRVNQSSCSGNTNTNGVIINQLEFCAFIPAPEEICNNGIDDDNNGIIDDCPFNCDGTVYVNNGSSLFSIDKNSGSPFNLNYFTGNFGNAIGFSKIDRKIYELENGTFPTIKVHDSSGQEYTSGFVIGGLPDSNSDPYDSGDINMDGHFYANQSQGNKNLVRIDITQSPPVLVESIPLAGGRFEDIAFHPISNELYGYDNDSEQLCIISPTMGTLIPIGSGNVNEITGLFFNAFGELYAYGSEPDNPGAMVNSIIKFDLATGSAMKVGSAPGITNGDACSCSSGISFTQAYNGDSVDKGSVFTFEYAIANSTDSNIYDVSFFEVLTDGLSWASEPTSLSAGLILNATSITGGANANFQINVIPPGISTFQIDVTIPINYFNFGPYSGQAQLYNMPVIYGGSLNSDNANTIDFLDPTTVPVAVPIIVPRPFIVDQTRHKDISRITMSPDDNLKSDNLSDDGLGLSALSRNEGTMTDIAWSSVSKQTETQTNESKSVFRQPESIESHPLIFEEDRIFNAITPNNDGYNDHFKIENITQYTNSELTIFDQRGRVVFHKFNYQNDWQGNFNGTPLLTGTYFYLLNYHSEQKPVRSGFLEIIN